MRPLPKVRMLAARVRRRSGKFAPWSPRATGRCVMNPIISTAGIVRPIEAMTEPCSCRPFPRLNRAGVTNFLTGSMASNYWGIPRTTHDLDFVVPTIDPLRAEFSAPEG